MIKIEKYPGVEGIPPEFVFSVEKLSDQISEVFGFALINELESN